MKINRKHRGAKALAMVLSAAVLFSANVSAFATVTGSDAGKHVTERQKETILTASPSDAAPSEKKAGTATPSKAERNAGTAASSGAGINAGAATPSSAEKDIGPATPARAEMNIETATPFNAVMLVNADTVAKIGDTEYSSLQDAVNAIPAKGSGTIEIVSDFEIDQVIQIQGGRKVTLVSEGEHTITFEIDYEEKGIQEGEKKCFNIGSTSGSGGSSLTIGEEDDEENILTITSTVSCNNLVSVWSNSDTAEVDRSKFTLNSGVLEMQEDAIAGKGIVGMYYGNLEMNGGTIQNNKNSTTSDTLRGGIGAGTYSKVVINGGTIRNCSGKYGGGLYVWGSSQVTINGDAVIEDCQAEYGGGVYVQGHTTNPSTVTMNGGMITQCSAKNGSAVHVGGNSTFTMDGGTIAENKTTDDGESVHAVSGTGFTWTGGTIMEAGTVAVLEVEDSGKFMGYASLQEAVKGIPSGTSGTIEMVGDVTVTEVIQIKEGKKVTLLSEDGRNHTITFQIDYAEKDIKEGEQKCFNIGSTETSGGSSLTIGKEDDGGNTLTITSTVLCETLVSVWSTDNTQKEKRSKFTLNSGTLEMPEGKTASKGIIGMYCGALEMNGGTIRNNKNATSGNDSLKGGISVSNSKADIVGGTISNCSGENGGGIYVGGSSQVAIDGTAVIEGCTAAHGGGIYVQGGSGCEVELDGGAVRQCEAVSGGGVFIYADAIFRMKPGSRISGCKATNGGGIYAARGTIEMNGGEILENETRWQGGGIYLEKSSFRMEDGSILKNCTPETKGQGGGVYAAEGSSFTMDGGTVSENRAHGEGAGIYIGTTGATISKGRITGNISTCNVGFGGGIYIHKDSALQLYNTVIKDNQAFALGGGLWTCNTGSIQIYITDGGAVYDNQTISGQGGYVSQAGADISHFNYPAGLDPENGHLTLYQQMLGGGWNQYYRDGNVGIYAQVPAPDQTEGRGGGTGAPVDGAKRYGDDYQELYTDTINKNECVALKNVVTEEAKAGAELIAEEKGVIISGNSASRGGGIGTNGNLVIGRKMPEENLYTVNIKKEWSGDTPNEKKTEVTVYLQIGSQKIGPVRLNQSNDWKIAFTGLKDDPETTEYQVWEDTVDGFTQKIDKTVSGNTISFTIVNTWSTTPESGGLTVSKTVAGTAGDTSKAFTFSIKLTDGEGRPVSGTFHCVGGSTADGAAAPAVESLTFSEDGEGSVTLSHGQSVTVTGLPEGTRYTVTESGNEGYIVTPEGGTSSGEITKEGSRVSFLNTKDGDDPGPDPDPDPNPDPEPKTGGLIVSKTVSGSRGNTSRDFRFTVTLGDTSVEGRYGDMTFYDGVAVFTLRHGQSVKAEGLPAGIRYTVAESDNAGYRVTSAGETGTIPAGDTASVLFNNYKGGGGDDDDDDGDGYDPGKPTGPTDPTDPGKPVDPTDPGKPTDPGNPVSPVNSDRPSRSKTPSDDIPRTGDETNLALWLALLGISGFGVVAILLGSKWNDRKKRGS